MGKRIRWIMVLMLCFLTGMMGVSVNTAASQDQLVIASWQSLEDWENFKTLPESSELHNKVNGILGHETVFRTYIPG